MGKEKKDWTIMIYMAGDNNLSVDMAYSLEQIKSVAEKDANINLFVYYDGYSSNVPTLYCDFTQPPKEYPNFYRSFYEDKLIKRDEDGLNENSAAIHNVINFVDWCVNRVPYKVGDETRYGRKADNYAMIFSGHSFGFQSEGLYKDEKSDYHMTLAKLKWMFERITFKQSELEEIAQTQQNYADETWSAERFKERTTEILGQPLALLGFDSCVMSMLEIGCQFRKVATTMVASEGSVPNAGWSYAQLLLGEISGKNASDPKTIAADFVRKFIGQQNKFALADISVDMAAWDLEKLPQLETAFTTLAENLLNCFDFEHSTPTEYQQMKRILMQVHWQCQTYMFEQNVDLGDFCQLLLNEIGSIKEEIDNEKIKTIIEVGNACKNVLSALRECIILSGFSGSAYQYSNGISLFFPWSWSSYSVSRENYESLLFVKKNKAGKTWNEFLIRFLSEVSLREANPIRKRNTGNPEFLYNDNSDVFEYYQYVKAPESNQPLAQANTENADGEAGIPLKVESKVPWNAQSKVPWNAQSKVPWNPQSRVPLNPQSKVPLNPQSKVPLNPQSKVPLNPQSKVPLNAQSKLFNALNLFFAEFSELKNVESHWNRSGFTYSNNSKLTKVSESLSGSGIIELINNVAFIKGDS
jgi:hypothetical protein